jgi:hypothetical protein
MGGDETYIHNFGLKDEWTRSFDAVGVYERIILK